jgi:hypothetical protein
MQEVNSFLYTDLTGYTGKHRFVRDFFREISVMRILKKHCLKAETRNHKPATHIKRIALQTFDEDYQIIPFNVEILDGRLRDVPHV